MLPERYSQLLTAYLDGELSPRRRRAVLRLLRKSGQARALFRRLQQDSRRLRALPAAGPVPDLAPRVLHAIAHQGLHPVPDPAAAAAAAVAPTAASAWAGWVGLAVAASLLLAITSLSFTFFSHLPTSAQEEPIVKSTPTPPELAPKPTPTPKTKPVADEPGYKVALHRLSAQGEQTRLYKELRKDTSYRLSLTCRDAGKAVDRLQRLLRARGVGVVVDRAARERMARKEPTTYLLYAENLHADELTNILRHLGFSGKGQAKQAPCETAYVSTLTGAQRSDLARLLGVAPDKLPVPPKALPAVDEPLPELKDLVIEMPVPAEKAKTGEPVRKGPPAPARLALVLAADAVGPAGPDVRSFLQRRPAQRPGTLQVLVVLREVQA
jgi:hypothetical protein